MSWLTAGKLVTSSKVSSPAEAAPTSAARSTSKAAAALDVPLPADERMQLADPTGSNVAGADPAPSGPDAETAPQRARRRARRRADRQVPRAPPLRAKKSAGSPPPRHDVAVSGPTARHPIRCGSWSGAGRSPGKSPDENVEAAISLVEPELLQTRGGREVDAAGLEERDVLSAAGEIALGDVQQRAEDGRAHHGLVLRKGIGEHDLVGAGVVCGDPQPLRPRPGR